MSSTRKGRPYKLPVRVTVYIPTFNGGRTIEAAINSVLDQTYKSYEIIVVNDASTDPRTLDWLKMVEQERRLPWLKVLHHTTNQGQAAARNTALAQARGEYFLPLDDDDLLASPTYMEKAVEVLDANPQVGIVYGLARMFVERFVSPITNEGERIFWDWHLPPYQFPAILFNNCIFNSAFYRLADWKATGGYKSNVPVWNDYDFVLSVISLGREVVQLPDVVYYYRQYEANDPQAKGRGMTASMTKDRYVQAYEAIYHNHEQLYRENIGALFEYLLTLQQMTQKQAIQLQQLSQAQGRYKY